MSDRYSHVNKTIASNIRKVMVEKSLSNSEVVKLTGISAGTVSKILNQQIKVTADKLYEFSKGLDVPVVELLDGLENIVTTGKAKKEKVSDFSDLYVGILSIGDRRICCVKDSEGNVIGESELTDNLVLTEAFSTILHNIKLSIAVALEREDPLDAQELKKIHLATVVHCYEFEETRQKYLDSALKHFKTVEILSDWQVTYLASFGNKGGISVVVDKGVSLSYMHEGTLHKLGGWGFPIYDMGGEYWLGMMAVRHTIQVAEGFAEKSRLSRTVLAKYQGKLERLIEYCIKNIKDFDKYSEFCGMLVDSYFAGGQAAKKILSDGASEVEAMISRIDSIVETKLPISINGSLSHVYIRFIDEARLIDQISDQDKIELLADIAKTGYQV